MVSQTNQALVDLPSKIQTSSSLERIALFEQLHRVLKGDVPDAILKEICAALRLTLPRYSSAKARRLPLKLIEDLLASHTNSRIYLVKVLDITTTEYGFLNGSQSIAKIALTALNWSTLLAKDCLKSAEINFNYFKKIVEIQSKLLYAVTIPSRLGLNQCAYKKMCSIWKLNTECGKKYFEVISKMDPNLTNLVIWGFLFKYLAKNKENNPNNKQIILENFVKLVFGSKNKVPYNVLEHSRPFLKELNHEEFSQQILPAMQKALLRNPEVILESVGIVIDSVSLDLSQYATELGKSLGVHLCMKEDSCRKDAIKAFEYLAKQCSSPDAIVKLVDHLFSILNGSEGKLTVVTQRMGVLSGIGSLSHHSISGANMQQTASDATIDHFIGVLKLEIHEGTVIHALKMMSLWCSKLTNKVPDTLIDWFKKGIVQKSATPLIRVSYFQCMYTTFQGNTISQAMELAPILVKALEKISSQQTQVNVISEGLVASCLILKLYTTDVESEAKLKNEVASLYDLQKLALLSEKFLNSASPEVLCYVPTLIEYLILDHYTSVMSKTEMAVKAMLFCLLHPSRELRLKALASTKKIISAIGGCEFAQALLQELPSYSEKINVQDVIEKVDSDSTNVASQNKTTSTLTIRTVILVECLLGICSGYKMEESDAKLLGKQSLFASSLPVLSNRVPKLWDKLLAKLGLDADKFLKEEQESFQNMVLTDDVSPLTTSALGTLIRMSPDQFLPPAIKYVTDIMKQPSLQTITVEEYNIYLTPEGVLYDSSVIESLKEQTINNRNVKRESKLYSHKEQMEEMELKKELEAKKKAKGMVKEPELSKKQLEAKKAQLDKESAIRKKIAALDVQYQKAVLIIKGLLEKNGENLAKSAGELVKLFLTLFKSPLCAPQATKIYILMSKCVFEPKDQIFGEGLAYVTLRIIDPACQLDENWLKEDIKYAIEKRVNQLANHFLSGAAFAYVFPLLNLLLTDKNTSEEVVKKCLDLISVQVALKDVDDESSFNMPIKQMLETLVIVIGNAVGRMEKDASDVLLSVAQSIADGLGQATMSEFRALLNALQSPSNAVRKASLESLVILADLFPDEDEDGQTIMRRIFIAKFDPEEDIRAVAESIWADARLSLDPSICDAIISDITHPEDVVRVSAADAVSAIIKAYPDRLSGLIEKILEVYHQKLVRPLPVMDFFGRVSVESIPDDWEPRLGIAQALNKLAEDLNENQVTEMISFFVEYGLRDRHPLVQKSMLDAAISIVGIHGNKSTGILLPVFEDFLDKAPDNSDYDAVRQSVVILMGTLARHLDKGDSKIKPIVGKLIETLSKPSQQVQEAVANCLPPLVPAIKEEASILVKKLLELLLEADNYGERRGAAYGLAGLVKGLGILSLKQLEIMNILTEAIQDKKNYRHREGALFALEMLCIMLGRLFEPYIVHILPHLLLCFGDGNQFVREATDNTAKAVMSKLSAHGVKLVLPSLLQALEEDSWRTKAGSVELLGAMAFCAPKQLSSCLPSIVPKLIEVLSDSHVKVQKAGAQALRQIGSVIRNPEIQAIVPDLLEALQDPSKKTSSCLSILLETRFVHFIDAPSLALIMPVVQRAFQDRSTGTRKMAAQIIGNMYSLTDQKDLSPYLPTILPGLKQSLLDPVPEVRSVSARALGALVKGMGESSFEDLLPWLMQTLTSENSPVDRSGAAQGLSEVMGSLGVEKLHKHIPDIIAAAERTDIAPHVKDGYIMMFIYLPVVFTKEFTPYIGQIIIPILKALADETEFVRETALKAGQRIVNTYAQSAIQLLLPELEKGLFDVNWRIRYSSIQLLGDLLYKISGVSGKMTTETADEDDNFGTEQSHKAIIHLLGGERRNRVLAGLYMGRSDVALMVRQAALHVWKVVVTNTPRTLREILPTLFSLLLGCLASNSYDKRQVAARTLGDLVRKLGERVLPEIIPILERGLKSDRADQRQGVCIGLSEIMSSTSREMVLNFVDSLVPTIKMALCDPLPEVRVAAAKTFDSLHLTVGVRALDDIIPPLLQQLSDPDQAEYTLDGLRQVMAIKSKVVLPYLVPQLTTPPVNTKALSLLSTVAGDALTRHLSRILPALLLSLGQAFGTPNEAQELEYCQAVVLSVTDDVGVRTIIDTLLEASKQESLSHRQAAVALLCAFCSHTKADINSYVSQLLRGLIHLFTETDPILLKLSWETLNAVIKTLNPNEQIQHVADIRQAVRFAVSDLKGQTLLPGFCLPKGITPILPVFRDAILNGVPELKEQAAQGLGEVIQLTSADALKPSVVHITGPLIRILGDRFSWNVKVAILETLALLLEKVGAMLKPFLPQLQTTFLKALSDTHRLVRLRAASALSHLITIHIRCDPLFTELHNSAKNTEDITIKETMLHALRCVVTPAGDKMSDSIRRAITNTMNGLIATTDDNCRVAAAGCLGAIMKWLPEEELESLMKDQLLDDDASNEWMMRHGKSVALMIALKEVPEKLIKGDWTDRIAKTLISYMGADRLPIALTGIRGTGYFLYHILKEKQTCPPQLLSTFAKNMNHSSNEVKQVVALTCNFLGKRLPHPLAREFVRAVVPLLVNGTKEKNTVVKANSEFALVTILGLRTGEETQQTYLAMLDAGGRDSLQDVINKVLKKVASQAEMKEEELDDTLMS